MDWTVTLYQRLCFNKTVFLRAQDVIAPDADWSHDLLLELGMVSNIRMRMVVANSIKDNYGRMD